MSPFQFGAEIATAAIVVGAVVALSARDVRLILAGLVVSLGVSPLLADPLPSPLAIYLSRRWARPAPLVRKPIQSISESPRSALPCPPRSSFSRMLLPWRSLEPSLGKPAHWHGPSPKTYAIQSNTQESSSDTRSRCAKGPLDPIVGGRDLGR